MLYAIEDLTVDTTLLELRSGAQAIPVEPQVFELLTFLIEQRDRVVSKDEIFAHVWKGRIVSDAALSSRIKAARKAIGDDGASQRLIRTLPRRGLRFVGDVRPLARPQTVVPAAPSDPFRSREDAESLFRPEPRRIVSDVMQRPAIAVLPFADVGGTTGYLADGVTDEVTAALCAWRLFPVISRNTSFRFRDSALSAPELGAAMNARYLLAGRLQRGDDRVKLTAALIDAEADREIWTGRITRAVDEIFTLEEELARQVVSMLEPEMRGAEIQRILRKPAGDITAWDLAMRASWCANRPDGADFDTAERLAGEAASLAPDWYLPQALLAFVKFQRAMRHFSAARDTRIAFADTLTAARNALEIDSGSWLAHALTAVGELWTNLAYDRALSHVMRAIELNPSACQVYHFGGCITGFSGDPESARRLQGFISRIDPAYPYRAVIEADIGLWHLVQEDYAAAEEHLENAVQWDPTYGRAYQRRASLFGLTGRHRAAREAVDQLTALGLPLDADQIINSYPFQQARQRDLFMRGLRNATSR